MKANCFKLAPYGIKSEKLMVFYLSGDGRGEFDNSMVVSMEINGIMYQGVLFAQAPPMLPVPPRRF